MSSNLKIINDILKDTGLSAEILIKTGRNDSCPCKSGKKFKKCHLSIVEQRFITDTVADYPERKKYIKSSDSFPIYKCFISPDWKQHGLARVAIIRAQPNQRLVAAAFLVDTLCLGVKDAFCNAEISKEELEEIFLPQYFFDEEKEEVGLDFAKALILGSIKYAEALGFKPHKDFELASHVLGEKSFSTKYKIKFGGPNDVPLYVIGPNDNSRHIIKQLELRLGKGGFEIVDPQLD